MKLILTLKFLTLTTTLTNKSYQNKIFDVCPNLSMPKTCD